MKVAALQLPYPYSVQTADAAVASAIRALEACDPSLDLIVLPEYVNAPTVYAPGQTIPYAQAHTQGILEAAVAAAKRCHAMVALNLALPQPDGKFRNTTRVYGPDGALAGEYYKIHLPRKEVTAKGMDESYVFEPAPPVIVEVAGLRLGFQVCYDCYFDEQIAALAHRHPDVVLVSSHQRAERHDILEMLTRHLAFETNAFVVRASVSMGKGEELGGGSMIASPDGRLLAEFHQEVGRLECEIGDPHWKYQRSNTFGGPLINNDAYIEQGRVPCQYRPAGAAVRRTDAQTPFPRLCAHRGFNTIAPENSLAAYGAAIALGATEIEFDVRSTKDDVLVVCHDPDLARVSNGSGMVENLTLAELDQLDFGGRFAAPFAGLKITRVEEIFRRFQRQVICNIHIKEDHTVKLPQTLKHLKQLIEDYDVAGHVYIAAGASIQAMVKEMLPGMPRCMLAGPEPWKIVDNAIRWGCGRLQLYKPYWNREMIAAAHAAGIHCNLFYADDPAEAKAALRDGVDTILTNNFWPIANALKIV